MLFGALVLALLLLTVALWSRDDAFARRGMLQPSDSAADRYFRELGAPPDSGPLTDFRHNDQDGMVAEYASGSYRVQPPREEVLDHYRAACRRLGLASPASAETVPYYPEALCSGAVIVTVTPRCAGATCTVFVEVTG